MQSIMKNHSKECLYEHFSTTNNEMFNVIHSFIEDKELNYFDMYLFRYLEEKKDYKNRIVIKYNLLSSLFQMTQGNIKKSMARLVKAGFIRKVKNTRPPVYMINPIYSFKGTKENHQKLFDEFYGL